MTDAGLLVDTLRLTPKADVGVLDQRWAHTDARALIELADQEGAALWLQRRVKALGLTLVADARDMLIAAARRDAANALRVDAELEAVLPILDASDLPVALLKSAAMRRLVARIPYGNARAPVDVDLLLPTKVAQRAWDLLVEQGYTQRPELSPPADGHHLPVLISPRGVAVELHVSTLGAVPPNEAWRRATFEGVTTMFAGRARPIPSDTELLWHAISHAVSHIEERALPGLRLKTWLDAAALLTSEPTIDWNRIEDRLDSAEMASQEIARRWLRTAADFSGRPLPPEARRLRNAIPLQVKRMVSWRLRTNARHPHDGGWKSRLLEEGARGEVGTRLEPSFSPAPAWLRLRHTIATHVARGWWLVSR